ncbi:MAG: hypothetical protein QOJ71_772 [Actinomycetota bacterium]|jgi:hypothetical protein|nr:hypothetical protein [Actinomycetota bacterium]
MPPTANEARPKIGPLLDPPVNGSNPVGLVAAVTPESVVGVEPAVTDVEVGVVEPWVPTTPPVVEVVPPSDVLVSPLIVVVVSPAMVVLVAPPVVVVVPAIVVVVPPIVVVVPAIVVVVPPIVVVVDGEHCDASVTVVDRVAVALSVQVAWTVRVTVPVEPPGTVVVAEVDPDLATLGVYPVTANVWAPSTAVAESMCITQLASLLPIVHEIACLPFEHTVVPDSTGWCAHAGSAVPTTNMAMIANDEAARTAFRRPRLVPLRASILTLPPSNELAWSVTRSNIPGPAPKRTHPVPHLVRWVTAFPASGAGVVTRVLTRFLCRSKIGPT